MSSNLKTIDTMSNHLSARAVWATMQLATEQPTLEEYNFRKRNFDIYVIFEDDNLCAFEQRQNEVWESSNKKKNLVRSDKKNCLRNGDYVVANDGYVVECDKYINDVEYKESEGEFVKIEFKYWLKVRYNKQDDSYDTIFLQLNEKTYKEMRDKTQNAYSYNHAEQKEFQEWLNQ